MDWNRLKQYYKRCLQVLPESTSSHDTTKMVILFFGLSGLDCLGSTDLLDKKEYIEWIYANQIHPTKIGDDEDSSKCGFRGSLFIGANSNPELACHQTLPFDSSHVTMVYSALASLVILGDDLSRVCRSEVLEGLASLQQPDGSFKASWHCPEMDLRFIFSVLASCYILHDFTRINREDVLNFIRKSRSYDGAFGQRPQSEGHGGSTYCAIASLVLLDQLDTELPPGSQDRENLIRWLMFRQTAGFHGRPNKPDDSCYTFWIGATLKMLKVDHLIERCPLLEFVYSTQNPITGGCCKYPASCSPDPLHSYLALAGLATLSGWTEEELGSDQGLHLIQPELNLSDVVLQRLEEIHARWDGAEGVVAVS